MTELKTKATTADPIAFLNAVESDQKKTDSFSLLDLFQELTGEKPVLWGSSIIGFGKYHYKSDRSSQEGDWPLVGFSPRKQALTLYALTGSDSEKSLLAKLGKHKASVGCVYIKKLSDVDQSTLEELIKTAYEHAKKIHGGSKS